MIDLDSLKFPGEDEESPPAGKKRGRPKKNKSGDELAPEEITEQTPVEIIRSIAHNAKHPGQFQAAKLLHQLEADESRDEAEIELDRSEVYETFYAIVRYFFRDEHLSTETVVGMIRDHFHLVIEDFPIRQDSVQVDQQRLEEALAITMEEG